MSTSSSMLCSRPYISASPSAGWVAADTCIDSLTCELRGLVHEANLPQGLYSSTSACMAPLVHAPLYPYRAHLAPHFGISNRTT